MAEDLQILSMIEMDLSICDLVYGESPCAAAIGVTGDHKCFNTKASCQDRINFSESAVTLRFGTDTGFNPPDIDLTEASITGLEFTPATVSLGENLGERATLIVRLRDHPHSDTGEGMDPYVSERGYNPWDRGTFWGRFRARQPFLRGRPLRLILGLVGQTLEEMETRHFVIESFSGPTPEGEFTIEAKDILKLADGDRAQAPAISQGYLNAAIDDNDLSAELRPVGIGNSEYPEDGYLNIAGKEIVAFTRVGDVLTLTRGQLGTTAVAHEGEDRCQLVLTYSSVDAADIIHDLLVNYAGVPSEFINLSDWQSETAAYLRVNYTAVIPEATALDKLISELIQQAGLVVFWDDLAQRIRLQVLRQLDTSDGLFDDSNVMEGTLTVEEQLQDQITQVWTYYGQINPLEELDNVNNYRSGLVTVDTEAEDDYDLSIYTKIMSRWIPAFGRLIAQRANDIQLGRFRDPPRLLKFSVWRFDEQISPRLGGGYGVMASSLQDETGARVEVPIQITRLTPRQDRFEIEATEMRFTSLDSIDLVNRTVIIEANTLNFDLRPVHDSLYPALPASPEWSAGSYILNDVVIHEGSYWIANTSTMEEPGDAATDWDLYIRLTCIIATGVVVGSENISDPAFRTGEWPTGFKPIIQNRGIICGRPGNGGRGGFYRDLFGGDQVNHATDGTAGGLAFLAEHEIDLDNDEGVIGGGGGGGGGGGARSLGIGTSQGAGGGGSGAGYLPATPGQGGGAGADPGETGTVLEGGDGGTPTYGSPPPNGGYGQMGGDGGDLGENGEDGVPASGGAQPGDGGLAGAAIDGHSLVTYLAAGDIFGAQIN